MESEAIINQQQVGGDGMAGTNYAQPAQHLTRRSNYFSELQLIICRQTIFLIAISARRFSAHNFVFRKPLPRLGGSSRLGLHLDLHETWS